MLIETALNKGCAEFLTGICGLSDSQKTPLTRNGPKKKLATAQRITPVHKQKFLVQNQWLVSSQIPIVTETLLGARGLSAMYLSLTKARVAATMEVTK